MLQNSVSNSSLAGSFCFARIFAPEAERKEQKIPWKFVRDALKEVPGRLILHSASRGSWPVEVVETENGVFLRNGWQRFVEDHSLQEYDFLLFTYNGASPSRLQVQIFDQSGLERDYSMSMAFGTEEEEEGAYSGVENKEKCNATREEKAMSFMPGSKHPLFDRRMESYNVGEPFSLFIPKDFGEEHFPGARTVVTLRNAQGQAWEVNCKSSNGRKFIFLGGWRRFARENNLQIGNVCIFELVGKMTLQVHIF